MDPRETNEDQSHYNNITWVSQITVFVQQLIQANHKVNTKALHHWSFLMGSHQLPVDTLTKG